MPRAIGKRHQDDVRKKIQASLIINRLTDAFNGTLELTAVQVNIGKSLLDKVLPDLKAIEHSGDSDNPLAIHTIERVIIDHATDKDA